MVAHTSTRVPSLSVEFLQNFLFYIGSNKEKKNFLQSLHELLEATEPLRATDRDTETITGLVEQNPETWGPQIRIVLFSGTGEHEIGDVSDEYSKIIVAFFWSEWRSSLPRETHEDLVKRENLYATTKTFMTKIHMGLEQQKA